MTKNFRHFMFEHFRFVILDIDDPYEIRFSKEELDVAWEALREKIKIVPFHSRAFLTQAVACVIRAIKNRRHRKNPFTDYGRTQEIKDVLDKINDVKKRRTITQVSFDDIQFTGTEIQILFGSKFEHLRIDNYHMFNFLNCGVNNLGRKPETIYKETYAASLNESLQNLGVKETSKIIGNIFKYAGLVSKASPQTINKYIYRGKTKQGLK